ncbi:uncharacterized protein [Zea mays]|uniref:DUF7642 domain-containing protein n=1 Tax=Zea mays TaxID=4577 RepID=B4FKL5_MAIZE|nr:uncharacterized protein LOC100193508 [Zea mays]XP_035822549.1 uncharacterized protein LOC100193508 isoform X1 [Zea mays]XP_035822550.1 uncharacterized protein LOC100193508 isoform X1 [Zea mays]ACF82658.1 unknown [Zea mays]AQK53896.1 hypothetical protein ZEAMMB73_Zm00001d051247 [Zea mays]
MLSGHAVTLSERSASGTRLIEDVACEAGDEEEADAAARVVYRASFQELMPNYLQYDTIIWALISLLLVLAWGIGLLLLLYLPYKRYVLKKDILSRQLFVTESKIVYKVLATRPSYMPFMGIVKKEIKVPLHLIVDVIIEQGCLQSAYSLYTFRIESIAHGKPASVDELQFHGVHNPDFLRKVITREASRSIREVQSWKNRLYSEEGPSHVQSSGLHSPSAKVRASPICAAFDSKGKISDNILLHKIEELNRSVKNLESLLVRSHRRE